MKEYTICTSREEKSTVFFGEGARRSLGALIGNSPFFLIDENVQRLWGEEIKKAYPTDYVYTMPAGEASKSPEILLTILEEMAGASLNRSSTLVAVGGGATLDVCGLAAALYMRGIECVYVPTTLLADVDAAIGGKTAVDLCGIKNLIGVVRQPQAVLVDPLFLTTLPRRELICGLGEIVKYGALSAFLFDELCACDDLFDLDFLTELIPKCIAIKADIVGRDPFDRSLRRTLNLGHTTAHSVELASDLPHGAAVLLGIWYEAEIAKRYLECDETYLGRLRSLCEQILGGEPKEIDVAACADRARLDKKNGAGEKISMIVPTKRGESATLKLSFDEYCRALFEIREGLC